MSYIGLGIFFVASIQAIILIKNREDVTEVSEDSPRVWK